MEFLHEFFHNRFISVGLSPPWNPNVTPFDFFQLHHLKNKIFAIPLAAIEELEQCITMEIQNIPENVAKGFPKYDTLHCYV